MNLFNFLLLKQIRMRSRLYEQKRQFRIVLFPHHQPVWFDVAFPLTSPPTQKSMGMVLSGKSSRFSQQSYSSL